jgi:hypothetical protein
MSYNKYFMNKLKRTTILLDEELVKLAKMKAASENLTLSKLISKLITNYLTKGGAKKLIGTITSSEIINDIEEK